MFDKCTQDIHTGNFFFLSTQRTVKKSDTDHHSITQTMKLIWCLDLKLIHLSLFYVFTYYTGIKLQNNFPSVVSLSGIGDILTTNHLIKNTVCYNSTRYRIHNYSYFEMYVQVIRKQMQSETNFHTHIHMQQSYQICNQLSIINRSRVQTCQSSH